MPHDSLHTLFLAAQLLGVHCNGCGHRAVLGSAELPKMNTNMTLLRSLKLRCKKCGLSGTAKKQFTLTVPHDDQETEAFLQGEISRDGRRRFERLCTATLRQTFTSGHYKFRTIAINSGLPRTATC